jgi:hypothetical protein
VIRNLDAREIETGRWDHLIAAGDGRGWCRAMFVVVEDLDVRLHVLCGSELVYSGRDASRAVSLYNAVPDGPEAVRELLELAADPR